MNFNVTGLLWIYTVCTVFCIILTILAWHFAIKKKLDTAAACFGGLTIFELAMLMASFICLILK